MMEYIHEKRAALAAKIAATEVQLNLLKRQLESLEKAAATAEAGGKLNDDTNGTGSRWPLEQEEYQRYGRQMIVPQVGLEGELLRTGFVTCQLGELVTDDFRFHSSRSTQATFLESIASRRRWIGLSCCTVPCWCGGGHFGTD